MLNLIDTHTHIYLAQFDRDRKDVIARAASEGISHMLMPNIDSHTVADMLKVARAFPDTCLPMMGLHPTSVKESYKTELDVIASWFEKGDFVAVGESGIDLYWDTSYEKEQKISLERHVDWALQYDLPWCCTPETP